MGAETELGTDDAALVVVATSSDVVADILSSEADCVEAAELHFAFGKSLAFKKGYKLGMGGREGHPCRVEKLLAVRHQSFKILRQLPVAAGGNLAGKNPVEQLQPVGKDFHGLLADRRIFRNHGRQLVLLLLQAGEVLPVSRHFGVLPTQSSTQQVDDRRQKHNSECSDEDYNGPRVSGHLQPELLLVALLDEAGVVRSDYDAQRIRKPRIPIQGAEGFFIIAGRFIEMI